MKLRAEIIKILQKNLNHWKQEFIDDLYSQLENSVSEHIQLLNNVTKKLEFISKNDILYTYREEGKFALFVTRSGEYKHCMPHETTLEMFENHNFQLVDNKVLVNMDHVKLYDGIEGRVYFDEEITKESIFAPASNRGLDGLKKVLGKEYDLSLSENKKEAKILGSSSVKKAIFGLF